MTATCSPQPLILACQDDPFERNARYRLQGATPVWIRTLSLPKLKTKHFPKLITQRWTAIKSPVGEVAPL